MANDKKKLGYARLKYGEEEEIWEEESDASRENKKKKTVPPRVQLLRRVGCILLAAVLVVALWMNRDSTFFHSLGDWFHTRLVGLDTGGGYPTAITGTQVLPTNIMSTDGMAVTLSDTALTIQNATAKTVVSRQHSFSEPRMCAAGGRWLVYNLGGTGYRVESISKTVLTGSTGGNIQAAAIAPSGRFALVTQTADNASRLTVYMANGEVQYTYSFYDAYITAVALNGDGTRGVVATASTNGGALAGTLYLLDFSREDAVTQADAGDNLVLFLHWGDNGVVTAVGDTAALYGRAADFTFETLAYESAVLAACSAEGSTVCLALEGGETPELVLLGGQAPVRAALPAPASSCSVFGGSAAALADGLALVVDTATGELLAQADVGRGVQAVAMSSESTAYVLGISQIRFFDFEEQELHAAR